MEPNFVSHLIWTCYIYKILIMSTVMSLALTFCTKHIHILSDWWQQPSRVMCHTAFTRDCYHVCYCLPGFHIYPISVTSGPIQNYENNVKPWDSYYIVNTAFQIKIHYVKKISLKNYFVHDKIQIHHHMANASLLIKVYQLQQ